MDKKAPRQKEKFGSKKQKDRAWDNGFFLYKEMVKTRISS